MLRNHDNLTYDDLQNIHSSTFSKLSKRQQDTTNDLLDEILLIKNNINKLIKRKEVILSSISEEEKIFLLDTIKDLTKSFEELDTLMTNLQSLTYDHSLELDKLISILNDPNNNLNQSETRDLLSQEDIIYLCPNCSISFTCDSQEKKCPSCGIILSI